MKRTCNVCWSQACTCNWSVCECWFSAIELRNIEQWLKIEQKELIKKELISNSWDVCLFEWNWPRDKCIKCGQFKFYATGHPCQYKLPDTQSPPQ